MARLPQPGSDNGMWGDILNEYLSQALKSDGTLKNNVVTANTIAPNSITNAAIATDAVNATSIADGSITEQLLESSVQAKLNSSGGAVASTDITDSTAIGRSLLTAASATAAKTSLSIAKADVGLANVDNTSDATKNSATVTLTNKTLSEPRIDEIYTTAGKGVLGFRYVSGAGTNMLDIANGVIGHNRVISDQWASPYMSVTGVRIFHGEATGPEVLTWMNTPVVKPSQGQFFALMQ